MKIVKDTNELVLKAFKFMIYNDHLVIPALQLGFQTGAITDFQSYQAFFDIKVVN